MAKETSVAPKERVNIVYRPSVGDAKEDVELPLKMLVVGNFTGSPDNSPLESRQPVNIDKDNFDSVLESYGVGMTLSVPDRLSPGEDGQDEINVSLKIESLKDFGPESVVEQVPELKKLLELREALKSVKGPLSNVPEFRKKIQELMQDELASAKLLAEIGIEEEQGGMN